MPRFIVCNVAWSDAYRGEQMRGSGGSYVLDERDGAEKFNFLPHNGHVYGYVAGNNRTIDCDHWTARLRGLPRIGPRSSVDRVTVVWCAQNPNGGVFVTGWYRDAILYRELRRGDSVGLANRVPLNGEPWVFNIETRAENAFLVPARRRTLQVPKGGPGAMGQSNVWYADSERGEQFRREVETFMLQWPDDP